MLHEGLGHPDDKLRLNSATAILNAHCKLASIKQQPLASEQLPPAERVERLRQALQVPDPELAEALRQAGYEQQIAQLPEAAKEE